MTDFGTAAMVEDPADGSLIIKPPVPPVAAAGAFTGITGAQTAASNTMASRLQARFNAITADTTKEFPVPAWDGELVMRARKPLAEELDDVNTVLETIDVYTDAVFFRAEAGGKLEQVPGGWLGLGAIIGHPNLTATQVIALVFDNATRWNLFSLQLVRWVTGDPVALEQALGE